MLYLAVLFVVGVLSIILSFKERVVEKTVYKYIKVSPMDFLYGPENLPSAVYKSTFYEPNVWMGGFTLGTRGIEEDLEVKV